MASDCTDPLFPYVILARFNGSPCAGFPKINRTWLAITAKSQHHVPQIHAVDPSVAKIKAIRGKARY